MASRLSKLKISLIADLVLLAIVIPGFFYVDSQISNPANFEVSDLMLDSDWVQVGEPVQISVDVTNIGDEIGNHTVTLTIDDVPVTTKTVQLSGGETTTVQFTTTETTEGNFTIGIDDLTKTLKVSSEKPNREAELELSNLVTSREVAGIGDPITVSVTASNIGDQSGQFTLELFVNNQKRETKSIQLDGGEDILVQFEIVENTEDNYEVKIGSLTTSFEVSSDAQPVKPAEFQVADLTINPSLALVNEAVKISVKITNIGEATGSYTFNLRINGNTRETREIQLAGQATEIVEFEVTETNTGTYNIEIGGITGSFTVEAPVAASEYIVLTRLAVAPYEVWEGESVTIRAKANNTANEEGVLSVRFIVDGEIVAVKQVTVAAGESDAIIEFTVTAGSSNPDTIKGYPVEVVNLGNQSNTLKGYFVVAPDGYHTLSINRSGGGSTPMVFTLDGVTYDSPYTKLLPVGDYSFTTEEIVDVGTGVVQFSHWNDGVETPSRIITLDRKLSMLTNYIVISGYASCPSLYIWNGTGYTYITEVSNAGWLGYIDYITDDGDIVFGGGNPWDHVKLDKVQLTPRNDTGEEYYDIVLFQQWDEIYYLDSAYLVAVDHPSDVDVYSTMVNYVNRGFFGKIYTVDPDNLATPVSAVNENGEDVLSHISELDSVFTPSFNGVESPSWDNIIQNQLTLDLGDLSEAEEIKLVINGMVDWGPAHPYYDWIDQFKDAAAEGLVPNGTQINPPSFMEVMDAQGNWVRVPQNRQVPIPGDYVPRTFTVNMTDLFAPDVTEYKIRITNFWNVTFDYIGIDTSPQADITVYDKDDIPFTATLEPLEFAVTTTNASGYFTKYGDVTELLLETDDEYVIGLQGDKVALKFPTDSLPPLEDGIKRSFFLYVSSWFKDHYGNWGYGFDYTVLPLPFRDMSGFPYPETESHPDTSFMEEWNTRAVNVPGINTEIDSGMPLVADLMKYMAFVGAGIAAILVMLIWKKS